MRRPSRALTGILLLTAAAQAAGPPRTKSRGSPENHFNWSGTDLTDGIASTLTGPGGNMKLEYRGDRVRLIGRRGATDLHVIPPASVHWSPNGRAVAVNNGEGSGQMSTPIIVVNDRSPVVAADIEAPIEAYFNRKTGCRIAPRNLSVAVQGWSMDGSRIWVSIENWERSPSKYCPDDGVYFALYDFSRRAVLKHLSFEQTMAAFCGDAVFRDRWETSCSKLKPDVSARRR